LLNAPGTANAFVIPGGKVFVHSGILNVCRSEDALAAVLGHEIAHNTASHAAERLSAAWVGNLTAGSLFFLAGALPGLALFGLWNVIGGYYLQDLLFYLPMGRKQESEADYIGLMMMAEACYDPRQAVGFWQRMESIQRLGGHEAPEMLSTHPSVCLCCHCHHDCLSLGRTLRANQESLQYRTSTGSLKLKSGCRRR
jgi:predicted Zn-dependent protease